MYANLSDEKAFVFSVALAEINRKIINQRLILWRCGGEFRMPFCWKARRSGFQISRGLSRRRMLLPCLGRGHFFFPSPGWISAACDCFLKLTDCFKKRKDQLFALRKWPRESDVRSNHLFTLQWQLEGSSERFCTPIHFRHGVLILKCPCAADFQLALNFPCI